MKAIIHYNMTRDVSGIKSTLFAEKMASAGVEVYFDSDVYGFERATEADFENADVLVTLGGDGTVLGVSSIATKYNLPVLGINIGNLGYLTAFEYSEADEAIALLTGRKLVKEERSMLETEVSGKTHTALNEIGVLASSDGELPAKVATLSAYSDGVKVDTFRADGLIVATPTGSTAYSLAAGGPIMEPCVSAILLTAICSHSLHNRPILVKESAKVVVEVEKCASSCHLVADGKLLCKLSVGDKITVNASSKKLTLLKRADESFYEKLYKKMIRGN